MIHDKIEHQHWSSDVDDWDSEFKTGDVVISPGHGSFRTMFVVHEINLNLIEYVTHRGVFWKEEEARRYAENLHDRTPLDQPLVPDSNESGERP